VRVLARAVTVRTFLCVASHDILPTAEVAELLSIVNIVQAGEVAHKQAPGEHMPQWNRWEGCFTAAHEYETRSASRFTWFLRLRPDAYFFDDMPSVESMSRHAVSTRARLLHGGKSRMLNVTAWHMQSTLHLRYGCKVGGLPGCSLTVAPCIVVDDQVAMVPRALAPSYFVNNHIEFRQRESWVDRTGEETAAGSLPHNASRGRPDANESAYFVPWGGHAECRACHTCRGVFCFEAAINHRLHTRLLPIELRAFPFRLYRGELELAMGSGRTSPIAGPSALQSHRC
jgi:hypothetical protein